MIRKKKIYLCVLCGKNPVDVEQGYDTCEECLPRKGPPGPVYDTEEERDMDREPPESTKSPRELAAERSRAYRLAQEWSNSIEGRPSVYRCSRHGDDDPLLRALRKHHGIPMPEG